MPAYTSAASPSPNRPARRPPLTRRRPSPRPPPLLVHPRAAAATLAELAKLSLLIGAEAPSRVFLLSRLVDLHRRLGRRGDAIWPLRQLLAAERERVGGSRAAEGRGRGRAAPPSSDQLIAAELFELLQSEGQLDEAMRLLFSAASPNRREADALQSVVLQMQTAFRRRHRAAACIAACERGRLDRASFRELRARWRAATVLNTGVRAWRARRLRGDLSRQKELAGAAKVLQVRQRAKIEKRKPQWPIKLAIMHARLLKYGSARSAPPPVGLPGVQGEAHTTLRAFSSMARGSPARHASTPMAMNRTSTKPPNVAERDSTTAEASGEAAVAAVTDDGSGTSGGEGVGGEAVQQQQQQQQQQPSAMPDDEANADASDLAGDAIDADHAVEGEPPIWKTLSSA